MVYDRWIYEYFVIKVDGVRESANCILLVVCTQQHMVYQPTHTKMTHSHISFTQNPAIVITRLTANILPGRKPKYIIIKYMILPPMSTLRALCIVYY